jgi:nuclear pore complex protein Nup155
MASTPGRFASALDEYWKDDFAPLQAAGHAVLKALREDEDAPDADLYRRISNSGSGSHLYFPATAATASSTTSSTTITASTEAATSTNKNGTSAPPPTPTVTMSHLRSIPLPPYLAQELKTTKSHSLMGLLSEARLAWMSVDSKVFLWSFHSTATADQGSSFCCFQVPSGQCVIACGLMRPKKGMYRF